MTARQCPASTIVDPPNVVYHDYYHPQVVTVVHPVEIVNRHHCVPVFRHCVTYTVRDEWCPPPGAAALSEMRGKSSGRS